jgi:hypothetical protein
MANEGSNHRARSTTKKVAGFLKRWGVANGCSINIPCAYKPHTIAVIESVKQK